MHKIALTVKVMELLEGTGVMQGEESPEIKAELDALKRTSKGVSGSVSLDTVGWLLDTLEVFRDSPEQGEAQAVKAAITKLNPIYEENGGTWTTMGELRAQEEKEAQTARSTDQEQDQEQGEGGGEDDRDPADIESVSAGGYGKPVYHEHTGALVGYWVPGQFTPVADTQV